jgi:hypothetical protein
VRTLPLRPDIDQLRRQARDLRRGAASGDEDAVRRLLAVSAVPTLSAAQLALAREHGFPSWARLKAEVGRRLAEDLDPGDFAIRPVASLEELTAAFDALGARSAPAITHQDRRFDELARRFPADRSLMLVLEFGGRIVGGLLACRRGDVVTPRAIAFEPGAPVEALMTRLLQMLEAGARRLGAVAISEGGVERDVRPLYERLGYRGRNPMSKALLPLPGRAREAVLRRAAR